MKLSFSLLILVWGGVLLIKVSLKYFNAFSLRVVQIGFNSVTYFFDSISCLKNTASICSSPSILSTWISFK